MNLTVDSDPSVSPPGKDAASAGAEQIRKGTASAGAEQIREGRGFSRCGTNQGKGTASANAEQITGRARLQPMQNRSREGHGFSRAARTP